MKIDPQTLKHPPSTASPLELAYALMAEAEAQPAGEEGKFRAMSCHNDILELADTNRSVFNALYDLGMAGRIGRNQSRLRITD